MEEKNCTSCGVEITNVLGSTRFKCPKCSKAEIVRCGNCRKKNIPYICKSCGFVGP